MNEYTQIKKYVTDTMFRCLAGISLAVIVGNLNGLAMAQTPMQTDGGHITASDATAIQLFRVAGKIDKAMLERFDNAIKTNRAISGLEFDNVMDSREIDLDAVMGLHDRIKQYHLSTAARGLCIGSCALLFMTGYTRTILPSARTGTTRVGLRPLVNQYNEFMTEQTNELITEIIKRSDGKITLEFMEKIYRVRDEIASLMIQYHTGKNDIQVIFLERGGEKLQPVEPSTAEGLGLKIGT
ncbi:hypothetical protein [Undibacterium sp. TJN19]|uniref:hypothetical protein n=1 Tax=Undibacterium sp. TJN19 TaxID=3413055 RepID=UPI003BF00086